MKKIKLKSMTKASGKIHFMIGFFLITVFPPLLKSQCHDDYFGFWKDQKGRYIELKKGDRDRIGNNEVECFGFWNYKKDTVFINHCRYEQSNTDSSLKSTEASIVFKVLEVDKQTILIRPLSDDMKYLFGQSDIRLFNEHYIYWDEFKLDSIYFSRLAYQYNIWILGNGKMLLTTNYTKGMIQKKYYTSMLNESELNQLKKLIFHSGILTNSSCVSKIESWSHSYPFSLNIFNNGQSTIYRTHHPHKNDYPLVQFIYETIEESKWKRINKKKAKL